MNELTKIEIVNIPLHHLSHLLLGREDSKVITYCGVQRDTKDEPFRFATWNLRVFEMDPRTICRTCVTLYKDMDKLQEAIYNQK